MKIVKIALILGLAALFSGCSSVGVLSQSPAKLAQKYASEDSKYINIDGLNIHYRDEGNSQGPAVILLHGVASSLHTWDGWVEQLGDSYRLIRLDLPGHGLTGPDKNGYELDYMLDKIHKFMQRLRIQKAHFAGNSLGGYISWEYAVRYPQQVDKLILIDSAGFPQKMPFIMNFVAWPGIGEMSQVFMPRFMVKRNVKQAYGDEDKVNKELVRRYHDLQLRKGNRGALVKVFRLMKKQSKNPHLGDDVVRVKSPVLLMWGEDDTWVPLSVLEQFKQHLANVEVVTYEGVGHMPMEELPVQSARDARQFLETGEPYLLPSALTQK